MVKKRKLGGGIRQRLAAAKAAIYDPGDSDDADDAEGPPKEEPEPSTDVPKHSKLAFRLLELFAWGQVSPQEVQRLAMAAAQDVAACEPQPGAASSSSNTVLAQLQMLASMLVK